MVQPLAPVLSAEEVTELLGLSPPTLRRLVKDGHLRAHRLPGGRKWVFRADEVLDSVGSWPAGDEEEDDGVALRPPPPDPVVKQPAAQSPIDVTSIWCPAPPDIDAGESHSERCAQAWLDAARRAGLDPTLIPPTRIEAGGDTYELRVGPRERVLVVDDDGEDVWQLIDAVWAEQYEPVPSPE